ncbi:hypothetical protein VNO77_18934 [Canavalia gladiata]|uniref:Uncharacterized protein n=1 Tax=Canavalia gladiata TaxID=3824 RepID=A0AAN9QP51_CANGL
MARNRPYICLTQCISQRLGPYLDPLKKRLVSFFRIFLRSSCVPVCGYINRTPSTALGEEGHDHHPSDHCFLEKALIHLSIVIQCSRAMPIQETEKCTLRSHANILSSKG